MYIDKDHKFLYLATPKTASTATAEALKEQLGFPNTHDHHGTRNDAEDAYNVSIGNDWTVCTTVRNHFAVITSFFCGRADPPFAVDYLANRLKSSLYFDYANGKYYEYLHLNDVNTTLRYQSLQTDLNFALKQAGLDPVEIPFTNPTRQLGPKETRGPKFYRKWFTTSSRAFVERKFQSEMNRLKFEW